MRCWEAKATRDIVELLSSTHVDWIVSHMGTVFYTCIVNRKLVRLTLHKHDGDFVWDVVFEPISEDAEVFFDRNDNSIAGGVCCSKES